MGAGRDHYQAWRKRLPKEARVGEVEAVVEEFFGGCYERGKGSHLFIVKHRWLRSLACYDLGLLTISVRKGRVPQEALHELVFAIGYMEWLRAHNYSEDKDVPRQFAEGYEAEHR